MKKIKSIIGALIIISVSATAQEFSIKKIGIEINAQQGIEYRSDNIPISINVKNSNSTPVKLLNPYDKKGNYLRCFQFTCIRVDKLWESTSISNQSKELDKLETFIYIDIPPEGETSLSIMLNNITTPKLLPGEYKITMEYCNYLGNNCIKGRIKAKNEISITILEEMEEIPKPEYISRENALDIARKANKWNYDESQKIKIFLKNGIYTVTFPNKLAPGVRGSDFALKIEVDAKSGKVLTMITGS
jgi:hypothetical protein